MDTGFISDLFKSAAPASADDRDVKPSAEPPKAEGFTSFIDDMFKPVEKRSAEEILYRSSSTGRGYEDAASQLRKSGYEPTEGTRQAFEMNESRKALAGKGIGMLQSFKRSYMPFGDVVGMVGNDLPFGGRVVHGPEYTAAIKKFKDGTATKEDMDTVALYEHHQGVDQNIEKDRGIYGKLVSALGGLAKITGEAVPATAALGMASKGISALRAGRGVASATGIVAEPSKLASATRFLGAQAALLPLTPAQYIPQAHQINIREGRDANDLRGYPTAVAYGYLQNVILGRLTNNFGQVPTKIGLTPRLDAIKKGAGGTAEMAGADFIFGAAEKLIPESYRTGVNFGALGKVSRGIFSGSGELGEGLEDALVQVLSFSALARVHRWGNQFENTEVPTKGTTGKADPGKAVEDGLKESLQDAADAKVPANVAAKARAQVLKGMERAVAENEYITKSELKEKFKDVTDPAVRKLIDPLIDAHVEKVKPVDSTKDATKQTVPTEDTITGRASPGSTRPAPKSGSQLSNSPEYREARDAFAAAAPDADIPAVVRQLRKLKTAEEVRAFAATEYAGEPDAIKFANTYADIKFGKPSPEPSPVLPAQTEGTPETSPRTGPEVPPTITPADPAIAQPAQSGATETTVPKPQTPSVGTDAPIPSENPTVARDIVSVASEVLDTIEKTPGLSPGDKASHSEAFVSVVEGMSEGSRKLFAANFRKAKFYATEQSLSIEAARDILRRSDLSPADRATTLNDLADARAGRNLTSGAVDPRTGTIYLDGAGSQDLGGKYGGEPAKRVAAIFRHEMAHIIDRGHILSDSQEFLDIFRSEIDVDGDPLTVYARLQPSEGFAEIVRVTGDPDIPTAQVAREFPKWTAWAKDKGLWPAERTGPEAPLVELFETRVGPETSEAHGDSEGDLAKAPKAPTAKALSESVVPTKVAQKPLGLVEPPKLTRSSLPDAKAPASSPEADAARLSYEGLEIDDWLALEPEMKAYYKSHGIDVRKPPKEAASREKAAKYGRLEGEPEPEAIPPESLARVVSALDASDLSARQKTVLKALVAGESLSEIGVRLGVNERGKPFTAEAVRLIAKSASEDGLPIVYEAVADQLTVQQIRDLGFTNDRKFVASLKKNSTSVYAALAILKMTKRIDAAKNAPDRGGIGLKDVGKEDRNLSDIDEADEANRNVTRLEKGIDYMRVDGTPESAVRALSESLSPDARAELEGALFNYDPDSRDPARDLADVVSAAWRGANEMGKPELAKELEAAVLATGAEFQGPQPGETTPYSGARYESLPGVFNGDQVVVVRKPIVLGESVVVKGVIKSPSPLDRIAGTGVPTKGSPEPYAVDRPEVEANINAVRGVVPETLFQKVREAVKAAWRGLTRSQEFLANTPENARINEFFRLLKSNGNAAFGKVVRDVQKVVGEFTPAEYGLFERYLLVMNQSSALDLNQPLRHGFKDRAEVDQYRAKLERLVAASPAVQKAIAARQSLKAGLVKEGIDAGVIGPEALENEWYFHQMVLSFVDGGQFAPGSSTPLLLGRDFQKARTTGVPELGREYDYNTSYLESEMRWMAQMRVDIGKEALIKQFVEPYDVLAEVRDVARQTGRPWGEVARELYPDHAIYAAQPGHELYKVHTIKEKLAEELGRGVLDIAEIGAEDVGTAMAMGGLRRPMLLPRDIVSQLNATLKVKADGPVAEASNSLMNAWKVFTLLNPKRLIGYTARNMTGDVEPVIAAAPGAFKDVPAATREAWDFYYNNGESLDVLRAVDLGLLDSSMTASEIPDASQIPAFKHLFDTPGIGGKVKRFVPGYFEQVRKFNNFRESVGRLAAYKYYLRKINAGESFNYGGSKKSVVDALLRTTGPEVAAAHLARNLLGDYGNLTKFGTYARKHIAPFYSWIEINFKRWPRLTENAIRDAAQGKPLAAGAILAANLVRMAGLYAAVWTWNNTVMSDEEKELSPADRASLHLNLGRTGDGSVRVFRRVGSLSDFTDWFGVPEAVALLPQYKANQIGLSDYATEIAKSPLNKAVQAARPDVKTGLELGMGASLYPDVTRPRPTPRGEIAAGLVGMRDELKAIKRQVGTGDTVRPGYGERQLGLARSDPGQAALSEVHDLRRRFLSNKGEPDTTPRAPSSIAKLRDAALADDPKAFADAKARYLESGGTREKFEDALKNLDPIAGKLNASDERKFTREFLTDSQREKLKRAREYTKGLTKKIKEMWGR